eukprot:6435143-Pyramimonas_sp.AAC.1
MLQGGSETAPRRVQLAAEPPKGAPQRPTSPHPYLGDTMCACAFSPFHPGLAPTGPKQAPGEAQD